MRAKAIAAALALGFASLCALPAGATAKPGFEQRPGHVATSTIFRAPHGYFFFISSAGGRDSLIVVRASGEEGESTVTYTRRVKGEPGRIRFGLGRTGEVDLRFVATNKTSEPVPGCTGGPMVTEEGRLVGTVSFHPPAGFTDLDRHRVAGVVLRTPSQACRHTSRAVEHHPGRGFRRLVAGDPDGRRRFEALTVPPFSKRGSAHTVYSVEVFRHRGGLEIIDGASATDSPESAAFAVPDLDALPATATVAPSAPFSGSATFELPSRRTASIAGDLSVELLEDGEVHLTGPEIDAGVCHGYSCTKSLPKALRPQLSYGFTYVVSGSAEVQTIR